MELLSSSSGDYSGISIYGVLVGLQNSPELGRVCEKVTKVCYRLFYTCLKI